MKKLLLAALLLCFLLLSLTACTKPPASGGTPTTAPLASGTADTSPSVAPASISQDAYKAFAADFFVQSVKEDQENPFVSPLSAYMVLGMVANGAANDTAAAFEAVLGLPVEGVNATCTSVDESLSARTEASELRLAYSIWLNKGFTPKKDFMTSVNKAYGADVFEENLQSASALINGWISEKTEGMIPCFLRHPPSPDTQMILINTLYMSLNWEIPLLEEATADRLFYSKDGSAVNTPFLSSRAHTTSFIEGDGAEGVVLPYTGAFGRQFGFVALRPTDGRTVTDFTADFKADTLEHYMDLAKDTELILRMPKFTREYNLDMKKPLSAMGLGIAFEPSRADFSNLSETPLFIGEALQKTKIEITENGTKAAAASMLTMIESSAAIKEKSEPRELILDSPYAYFLVDLELQSPLFMGVMESV